MLQWTIDQLVLDLKYTWKISRNASDTKTNLIIAVSDGTVEGRGEAAPNVRYDESPEKAMEEFSRFLAARPGAIGSPDELDELLSNSGISHALKFGIESAFIHYWCNLKKTTVESFLGILPIASIPISFSIPIMDVGKMKSFYAENRLDRFRLLKIKVNADELADAVQHLSAFCSQPLIVDANEAFTDVESCIRTLEQIKKCRVEILEQPLPAAMQEESVYLKKYSPFPLFGDESITDHADFGLLQQMFDGINVKLMKAGGYRNAVRLLKEARSRGLKTMIGCMVETTLAISSGLHLCSLADYADLDSFLVVKNEPYGLVSEENGILSPAKKRN